MKIYEQTSGEQIAGAAEFISTPETAAAFFKSALATADVDFVLRAMHVLAHSEGMADALAWAGLPRDYLSRALAAEGRLLMQALRDVTRCLGARLVEPIAPEERAAHIRQPVSA